MGQNGMRAMTGMSEIRKPVRGEIVATRDGNTYAVLTVGMKYVDVIDVYPVPSKGKHLLKIADVTITGETMNVD